MLTVLDIDGTDIMKNIMKSLKYDGEFPILMSSVYDAINKMNLKVVDEYATETTFHFELAEKSEWSLKHWSARLHVDAISLKGKAEMMVETTSMFDTINYRRYNEVKMEKFINLVILFVVSKTNRN